MKAIRHHVSGIINDPELNRNAYAREMHNQWKVPGWEKGKTFSRDEGKVVPAVETKGQVRERKAKNNTALAETERIANELGYPVGSVERANLGTTSHASFQTHPEILHHWVANPMNRDMVPKGLLFNYTEDGARAFDSGIRTYQRISPMVRDRSSPRLPSADVAVGVYMVLSARGTYRRLVQQHNIQINPVRSWNYIWRDPNGVTGQLDIVRELAERGLTFDEADNASQFAHAWLQQVTYETGRPAHVVANIVQHLSRYTTFDDEVYVTPCRYDWHPNYRRWLPSETSLVPSRRQGLPMTGTAPSTSTPAGTGAPSQSSTTAPADNSVGATTGNVKASTSATGDTDESEMTVDANTSDNREDAMDDASTPPSN